MLEAPWDLSLVRELAFTLTAADERIPKLYGGTPRWGFSAGYTPDLEGLLTGPSISANIGRGPINGNAGMSGDAFGLGFGTPGIGVTDGFGPLEMSQDFSRPWAIPSVRESARSAGVPSRYNVVGIRLSRPDGEPSASRSQQQVPKRVRHGNCTLCRFFAGAARPSGLDGRGRRDRSEWYAICRRITRLDPGLHAQQSGRRRDWR